MPPADPTSPALSNKRQRVDPMHDPAAPIHDSAFVEDQDAVESGQDEDDDEDKPKSDKKAGRRKIKIEFIQDKSRRHITFSKRKAGIMKKAYELSTLTGTQVLLLVVSETGLVYTFTTAKLQPLVTQPEGKNLIQACLNAPHGSLPSSMPVGTPIGRSGPMSMPAHHQGGPANVPGGLSIAGVPPPPKDDAEQDDDAGATERGPRKRRRASSSAGANASPSTRNNPSPTAPAPAPNTSPNTRPGQVPPLAQPPALQIPAPGQSLPLDSPRQGQAQPTSPNYSHAGPYPPPADPNMYAQAPPQHGGYAQQPPPQYFGHEGGPGQQGGGLASAHPGAWGAPPVQQGNHYARR